MQRNNSLPDGADRYGCVMNHQRGESVCSNSLLVRRDELEESLLRGLAESVLRTEAVEYTIAKLKDSLREEYRNLDAELTRLRERKRIVEDEISRLVQAIASGQSSKSVMQAIAERERELKGILDRCNPGQIGRKDCDPPGKRDGASCESQKARVEAGERRTDESSPGRALWDVQVGTGERER